jgi:deoxycytidylate deaminase
MFHAHASKIRSACLSRQVGAAVIDARANLIATGTNEVPKGGGGIYTNGDTHDSRCAYNVDGAYCRNTREQIEIITELIETVDELKSLTYERKQEVAKLLRSSRIGGLLEFSRAVHAELDAIVSAARTGNSLIGARLFVTTFPCHYCARHVVVAGIDEVQFIEPYPKSRALELHSDSITVERQKWIPPSKGGTRVLFRPFTGVAPKRYDDAFLKISELKDKEGTSRITEHGWLQPWDLMHQSYIQAEMNIEGPQ